MLKLPDNLTAQGFLEEHWQKRPLFMRGALQKIRPAVTRNELGWLATLGDVESRLIFVDRTGSKPFYRAETGPFDVEYLQKLPKRDWTLLVHDVEKHLPDLRALFDYTPFIPDWRIDDLMVSFAAPGGGAGPHRDNYDVFLCQGVGTREWRFSSERVADDRGASDDLALLEEFAGNSALDTREGDVLYLPPGVAHWGTAKRACMTYSIGMRAPEVSDIALELNRPYADEVAFYRDPDLSVDEAKPGYISRQSARRTSKLLGITEIQQDDVAQALGKFSTQPKDWLRPDRATPDEAKAAIEYLSNGGKLAVHGMALIAYDERNLYVNGSRRDLDAADAALVAGICDDRSLRQSLSPNPEYSRIVTWMLEQGAFEISEIG